MFKTKSGLNLDEVKSLLQKALRRKERQLALQATKELGDKLTWKSLFTFLFEDHCLSGSDVLSQVLFLYSQKNKRGCVELLLDYCKTCRVAACLPVVSLYQRYHPKDFDKDMEVDEDIRGLVEAEEGCLKFDMILGHLRQAWNERNLVRIMCYMKLVSACYDHEKRVVSPKGKHFLSLLTRIKPHVGQVALRMLYLDTKDTQLKEYIGNCYKLASQTDAPVRLILFSVVTHRIYSHEVTSAGKISLGNINWSAVGPLKVMPSWAVDKHTFRGKFGKSTKHLVGDRPDGMSDEDFEEFHGTRPKSDLQAFFDFGLQMKNQAIPFNPFWSTTVEMYKSYPARQQKTIFMTADYLDRLKASQGDLFLPGEKQPNNKPQQQKRKSDQPSEQERKKMTTCTTRQWDEPDHAPPANCPLLQIPNGRNKTYTRLDAEHGLVWKGPFMEKKRRQVLFFHQAMREVFNDAHTLQTKDMPPYVVFPMLRGDGASMKIERRDYRDFIKQEDVIQGKFVSRKSMGLLQLHQLSPVQIGSLPMSVWAHFIYRFTLNVGDTGLYNAVTDSAISFVFGIDLDEQRGKKQVSNILDLMFVKKPGRLLCEYITHSIVTQKDKLLSLLDTHLDIEEMKEIMARYGSTMDVSEVVQKLEFAKKMVAEL